MLEFITERIDVLIFLIALCVGLIYSIVSYPKKTYVTIDPNPFNLDKRYTIDQKEGLCYRYGIKKAQCDKNTIKSLIN